MSPSLETITAIDANLIFVRHWPVPQSQLVQSQLKGVIQLVHGIGEHSGRYQAAAEAWNQQGYAVMIHDCRGHGETGRYATSLGHIADQHGWFLMMSDTLQINTLIRDKYPNTPITIVGHSTGALAVEKFLIEHPYHADACVLSSPILPIPLLTKVIKPLLTLEKIRIGKRTPNRLAQKALMRWLQLGIPEVRTDFDWLSHNPQAVDTYLSDEHCGFAPSTQAWLDLIFGLEDLERLGGIAKLPKHIPYFILNGADDPTNQPRFGRTLEKKYTEARLTDVSFKTYPHARHELLKERHRSAVFQDIENWLENSLLQPTTALHSNFASNIA